MPISKKIKSKTIIEVLDQANVKAKNEITEAGLLEERRKLQILQANTNSRLFDLKDKLEEQMLIADLVVKQLKINSEELAELRKRAGKKNK